MRIIKKITLKPLAILLVVSGTIIALSAFAFLFYKGSNEERVTEISLTDSEPIAGVIRVDDFGHFIGEGFIVQVVVHYDVDKVVVKPQSVFNASFDPFERTGGHEKSIHQKLSDNIGEILYEVEIAGFKGITGNSYVIQPIEVEYSFRSSQESKVLELSFEESLHVGTYYGKDASDVPLQKLRGPFERGNTDMTSNLFRISGSLFLLTFFLLLFGWSAAYFVAQRKSIEAPQTELERLREFLNHFENLKWLRQEKVDYRIRSFESQALYFMEHFLQVTPELFWIQGNYYPQLHEIISRSYQKGTEFSYEDIVKATEELRSVFYGTLNNKDESEFFKRAYRRIRRGR